MRRFICMNLKLKKPIVFLDIESTGVSVAKDRIVEIALMKLLPDGNKDIKILRVNPEMPIPEEAKAVHGISDKDVADSPVFKQVAKDIAIFIEGCDLAGYNSNKFDIPLLAEEFLRAEVDIDLKRHHCVDVQVIFHKKEQRTLSAAYKFYCNKDLVNAHTAKADTIATYEILNAQVEKYDELPNDVESLSAFSSHHKNADLMGRIVFNKDNEEVFNFGKYKGKRVRDIFRSDTGYYGWMMKGDFPLYTKKVLTSIKLSLME